MIIAFTTSGDGLDAALDSRFGRAPKFLIYDLEKDTFQVIDNRQNLNAAQGAGIQAAEILARNDVQVLLTGHVGPKAAAALQAAGIRAVEGVEGISVAEALARYQQEAGRA